MNAEGWYCDPDGLHDHRWFSDGHPRSLSAMGVRHLATNLRRTTLRLLWSKPRPANSMRTMFIERTRVRAATSHLVPPRLRTPAMPPRTRSDSCALLIGGSAHGTKSHCLGEEDAPRCGVIDDRANGFCRT